MPDRDLFSRPQEALSLPLDPDSVMTSAQNANGTQQPFISSLVRDVTPFEEDISIADSGFAPSENALSPELIAPLADTPSAPPTVPPAPVPPPVRPDGAQCRGLCLQDPYPAARAAAENDRYGRIIRSSYSGRESSLSSMLSLLYHALRFSDCSEDVQTTLFDIALCKLHHLKLLGELLDTLGGDPKYFYFLSQTGSSTNWWAANPTAVNYAKNLGEALRADIAAQKAAIEEHYSAINYIDDNGVTTLLKRIVRDEEYHLKILTELYQRFCS